MAQIENSARTLCILTNIHKNFYKGKFCLAVGRLGTANVHRINPNSRYLKASETTETRPSKKCKQTLKSTIRIKYLSKSYRILIAIGRTHIVYAEVSDRDLR